MVEWRREGRGEECCGWCGCSCKGRGQGENEVGERERKWMNVRTRVIDIRRCPALLPHVCVIGMNKRSKDQMEGSTVVHDTTTARTRASTTPRPRFSPPSWALDPLVSSPIPTRPFGFPFPAFTPLLETLWSFLLSRRDLLVFPFPTSRARYPFRFVYVTGTHAYVGSSFLFSTTLAITSTYPTIHHSFWYVSSPEPNRRYHTPSVRFSPLLPSPFLEDLIASYPLP